MTRSAKIILQKTVLAISIIVIIGIHQGDLLRLTHMALNQSYFVPAVIHKLLAAVHLACNN